jgi:hypothetical protein
VRERNKSVIGEKDIEIVRRIIKIQKRLVREDPTNRLNERQRLDENASNEEEEICCSKIINKVSETLSIVVIALRTREREREGACVCLLFIYSLFVLFCL